MEAKTLKFRFEILLTIILLATTARIIAPVFMSHPSNFSPINALALFSGAYLVKNKLFAYGMPILSVWCGDLFINRIYLDHWIFFYPGWYWQYGSYLLITLIGVLLAKRIKIVHVIAASLVASILFFLISNFGVWIGGLMYPLTWHGLIVCYIAAIPFFTNTVLSDLFYAIILFGSFIWAHQKFSALTRSSKN